MTEAEFESYLEQIRAVEADIRKVQNQIHNKTGKLNRLRHKLDKLVVESLR